jgi:hypothetical protein
MWSMENARTIWHFRFGRSATELAMTIFRNLLVGTALLFTLSGCEFRKVAINDLISLQQVEFIVVGKTTSSEVVAQLGAPDEMAGAGQELVFRYQYAVTKMLRVDFGKILQIWTPVAPAMILSRGETGLDAFQVVFDTQGVVREHAFTKHTRSTHFNFWPF